MRRQFSKNGINQTGQVILEPEHWRERLQAGTPGARELLQSAREGVLDIYPFSLPVPLFPATGNIL